MIDEVPQLAPMSEQTERFQMKLREKLRKEERQITEEGLTRAKEKIASAIARQSDREPVLKTNMGLFNENENPTEVSQQIKKIISTLQTETGKK